MIFFFIYSNDYQRIMPAVLIDSRKTIPAILSKTGAQIKAYTDSEVSKITDNVLFYTIETNDGNLGGYFALQIQGNSAILYLKQLRPAFVEMDTAISSQINTFINEGTWRRDYV